MTPQPQLKPLRPFGSRSGQAISEYMILIALISVGSIAVLQVLSFNLKARLATVAGQLGGDTDANYKAKKVTNEDYRMRDLGNFQEGIHQSGD